MRDDNYRVPAIAQLMQNRHHLFAGMAIQCTGGFVGKNNLPPVHQRTRDTDPLLLTTGKLGRLIVNPVTQPQPLE